MTHAADQPRPIASGPVRAPAAPPAGVAVAASPILSVRNLTTCFRTDDGVVKAVDDVSFDLHAGETLAIVGESGCGKTVTSKSIMRLLPERTSFFAPGSRIFFHEAPGGKHPQADGRALGNASHRDASHNDAGRVGAAHGAHAGAAGGPAPIDILALPEDQMRRIRGQRIAMIFQEPMTSLNPVFTVGWQIEEALRFHTSLDARGRRQRAIEMLRLVDIPDPVRRVKDYPHQLSGGMRQRVMIAIALCCEPDILIADEPTTALDVTIQAQILELMGSLKQKLNTAIILITHNLGLVAQFCDRVMVMYAGRVIESAPVRDVFHRPRHPYTRALLDSIPKAGGRVSGRRLPTIEGLVPSLFDLPPGCRFSARCARRQDRCTSAEPDLTELADGRSVRCFFPLELTVDGRSAAGAEAGAGQ